MNQDINPSAATQSVAVGAGAIIVTGIIALAPTVFERGKELWERYGKKSKEQMNNVQKSFIHNCYEIEKDSPITTLDKIIPKNGSDKNDQLPELFRMDDKNKFPIVYHKWKGYQPVKD